MPNLMSSIEVLGLNTLDHDEWNTFVMEAINGTVFNTIEWIKVWQNSFPNATPLFIVLREKEIQSAIPLIKIRKAGFTNYYSMPYGDYGGILSNPKSQAPSPNYSQVEALFSQLSKLAKGRWGTIAISDFYDTAKDLESIGVQKVKTTTHILTLADNYQEIWGKLIPLKRQLVRQSQRKGVEIVKVKDEQDVVECYKMLEETAVRHGKRKPRFKLNFYLNIFNEMGKYLRWTMATVEQKKLATSICFAYKDTLTYWDGGAYSNALEYRPNDALMWDGIKWGSENRYEHFNLGGSPSKGLARFKEKWGAKTKDYWTYYLQSAGFKIAKYLIGKFKVQSSKFKTPRLLRIHPSIRGE
ncbi:MAG: GNAT family N-acetyltransferase [Candidatus Stahlbacteria bacterium]|nr:GNAT family N-acetyltransferase [Candidatus Stahlbacteria bacterium]